MSQAIAKLYGYLNQRGNKLQEWCTQNMSSAALIRFATSTAANSPALQKCSPESIYLALIASAQFGLEPSGVTGEGYIVPFAGVATFIPGYKGLIKLARQSGEIQDLYAREVYKDELFRVIEGTQPGLEHERQVELMGSETVAYYAIAFFTGGDHRRFEVMNRKQIEYVRSKSAGGRNPVWSTWFDEMAKKTVIRRMAKTLPMGHMFVRAAAVDAAVSTGSVIDYQNAIDVDDEIAEDVGTLEAEVAEENDVGSDEILTRIAGAENKDQLSEPDLMQALGKFPAGSPERVAWSTRMKEMS